MSARAKPGFAQAPPPILFLFALIACGLVIWSLTTSIFMIATLGVPYADYASWQLLTLINLVIAPLLAILGAGCFYDETDKLQDRHEQEPAP